MGYSKKAKPPVSGQLLVSAAGTAEHLGGKYTATTIAFVNSNPDTLTDTANNFLNKNLKAGMRISISGSTSNDGNYTIATVVAGTITLVAGDALTAEVAGDIVTIECLDRVQCKRLTVQALSTNTANVAVGGTETLLSTESGDIITPLNSVTLESVYLDDIYIDVGVNDEGVGITYEQVLM